MTNFSETKRALARRVAEKIDGCEMTDLLPMHLNCLHNLDRAQRRGAHISLRYSGGRRVWTVGTHPLDPAPTIATDDGLLTLTD